MDSTQMDFFEALGMGNGGSQPVVVSKEDQWETPSELFNKWDAKFHFKWDVCATSETSKCGRNFFSPEQDGLKQDWHKIANILWMNPPFSKQGRKQEWIKKAYEESQKGCTVVALLPANTDTQSFHKYCLPRLKKGDVTFLEGRPKFLMDGKPLGTGWRAIMVVVFRPPGETPNV